MPTQMVSLATSLLKLASSNFSPSAVALFMASHAYRGESTWEMTNRICDRYFPETRRSGAISRRAA
jgi:hypothetical protein